MKTYSKGCSKKSFSRGYPKEPEFQNSEYEGLAQKFDFKLNLTTLF
jgi:hypothetical protein